MNRREFVRLTAGAITLSALGVRDPKRFASGATSAKGLHEMSVAEFHSAQKFTATAQGRIAYIDKGNGPAALFLHGFPLNSFQWRGVIPELSRIRRCIAPDFLALGYTDVADKQSVAPQAQLSTLVQLLENLSISTADMLQTIVAAQSRNSWRLGIRAVFVRCFSPTVTRNRTVRHRQSCRSSN
jgi:haloalkane dehalogenase